MTSSNLTTVFYLKTSCSAFSYSSNSPPSLCSVTRVSARYRSSCSCFSFFSLKKINKNNSSVLNHPRTPPTLAYSHSLLATHSYLFLLFLRLAHTSWLKPQLFSVTLNKEYLQRCCNIRCRRMILSPPPASQSRRGRAGITHARTFKDIRCRINK